MLHRFCRFVVCSLFLIGFAPSAVTAQALAREERPPITGKALRGQKQEDENRPLKGKAKKPWPQLREAIEKLDKWPLINLFESE